MLTMAPAHYQEWSRAFYMAKAFGLSPGACASIAELAAIDAGATVN